MQVAFNTAEDLSHAVDELFSEFPFLLYYRLNSVAPYPGFQSHDGIEMYFIEEGSGNYLAGNQVYPLQPGTLMIVRPYTLHKVLQTEVNQVICRDVMMWKEQFIRSAWPVGVEYPLNVMPSDGCRIQFSPQ
jgi:mannose-6-phosphate isomerase-like protein (cupin superfamily)